jgi:hypothetical protein
MTFTRVEIAAYCQLRIPALSRPPRLRRWRGPCPIHGGKGSNFSVDAETGRWFCFSEMRPRR